MGGNPGKKYYCTFPAREFLETHWVRLPGDLLLQKL